MVFILATTEKHKVIPTILSRCQIYDFKRITLDDTIDHLEYVAKSEGIKTERRALSVIARKADGAMRDALSIFDQVAASCQGNVTYEATIDTLNVLDYDLYFRLTAAFAKSDIPEALLLYKEVRDKGFDSLFFINGLASHLRDLMVAADARTLPLLELPEDTARQFREQASSLPLKWYYAALKILNECDFNYRTASNKQLLVEVALIRLCQLLAPSEPPFNGTYRNPPLQNPAAPQRANDREASYGFSNPGAQQNTEARTSHSSSQPVTDTVRVSTPTPRPTATQSPKTAPEMPRTFRLSAQPENRPHSSLERKHTPVDLDSFLKAWNMYIAANQDQHILTSAMRKAKISKGGEDDFLILVTHPAQKQAFESASKLVTFLREQLSNDFIAIRAEMDPEVEVVKTLPPAEFIAKAIKHNPGLGDFLKNIEAEIS